MYPIIPREASQFISTLLIVTAVYMMTCTHMVLPGIALVGISVWIMMISESMLLSKVQTEMQSAMNVMSKKREQEVEDLLFFLRECKMINCPTESWEGAKQMVSSMHTPAFVMGPTFSIIKANKSFTDLLGWDHEALDGVSCHAINDPLIMSKVGQICTASEYENTKAMHLRYMYIHKTGRRVFGTLDLTKIVDNAFVVVFLPDDNIVVSQKSLESMLD